MKEFLDKPNNMKEFLDKAYNLKYRLGENAKYYEQQWEKLGFDINERISEDGHVSLEDVEEYANVKALYALSGVYWEMVDDVDELIELFSNKISK